MCNLRKKGSGNMEDQTINLLDECNSGCKMAIEGIDHVRDWAQDPKMGELLDRYKKEHKELEDETSKVLDKYGKMEKDPSLMATAMSWITTEAKLMMHGDDHQIAKLMMDGCNMGIQSVGEYMNKNSAADQESQSIAKKIIKVEENFMADMKQFL